MNISAKLVQICFVVSEKKMKMWNSHRVQRYYKSSHGTHLEFPIGKRFTNLVQDHPMIIPAKPQFNWDRKFKMAAMTWLSLTLDPMGISHFHLFFLKPQNRFEPIGRNVHWMVI
jgi:hypothetical protein